MRTVSRRNNHREPKMMKTSKTVSVGLVAAIALSLSAPLTIAGEGTLSDLTRAKRAEVLRQARGNLDLTTTSSIRSDSDFDARGVVKPNAEVTLGAGVSALISEMPFKEGQNFKKGDALVRFDCAKQNADLRGARAELAKAASIHKNKQRLKARGAAGSQEVQDAGSDVETAKAKADGLLEIIGYCLIEAPFDGRVVERHAETFEIPAANAPVLTIVDDSELELDLIVPSNWLRWVRSGSEFEFAVDELGQSFKAKVDRLGAKVDAVSQTIKMTGTFVERPSSVLAGMSGTAKFNPPSN